MRLKTSLAVLLLAAAFTAPARPAAADEHPWSLSALGGYGLFSDNLIYPTDSLANAPLDRKSTRLNSSHIQKSRMPSSA